MKYILPILLFVFIGFEGQAQTEGKPHSKIIQFSGIVVTGDSLSPVAYANVFRERDRRGTITDYYGFFTLPTFSGDTIIISCIGFNATTFVIPDTLTANRYNVVQFLRKDTVMLPSTFIYPWPTREKFKNEFLTLELDMNEKTRAAQNLESIMMYDRMVEMGNDGSENFKIAMRQQSEKNYWAGQTPPMSIFNPIAWAKFMEAWKRGDYSGQ